MKPSTRTLSFLMVAVLTVTAALAAGGKKSEPPLGDDPDVMTPEQKAAEHYNQGLWYRDRAWKSEEKAASESTEKKRAKAEAKALDQFEDAAKQYRLALEANPRMFQASSSLGYAYRKLGNYEDALAAYDQALSIEPRYSEAIEYRGQAYLGLGRVEDAKQAYVQLFGMDRPKADQLLAAMKDWISEGRAGGGEAAVLDGLASWVEEREEIAGQTASLTSGERSW